MTRLKLGAVRPFATAAVLTLLAVPTLAQMVERERTFASLTAVYPCNAGSSGRNAIVTDCQSASDIGGGGGSVRCFAHCDGSAPWEAVSIGGGGGVTGLTSCSDGTPLADNALMRADGTTNCQGSTVAVADTTGDMQWEGTTADDFEGNFTFADPTADWTWAWGAAGDLVGAGSLSIDNLKLDGNTLSSTDTNGHINLTPNGTGQVLIKDGSDTRPSIAFASETGSGIAVYSGNQWRIYSGSIPVIRFAPGAVNFENSTLDAGVVRVSASAGTSGTPRVWVAAEVYRTVTNEGVTAANYNTLPTAASGHSFTFCVQDADGIRITAGASDTIRVIDKVTAAAGYIESTTIGSCVSLIAINAVEWFATAVHGTWTDGTFTYDDTSLTTP